MKRKNKFIVGGVGIFALGLSFVQEKRVHKGASPWQTKVSSDESFDFKKDEKSLEEGHKQGDDSSLASGSRSDKSSPDDKVLPKDEEGTKVAPDKAMDGSDEDAFSTALDNFNLITNFRKTFYQKHVKSYLDNFIFQRKGIYKKIFDEKLLKDTQLLDIGGNDWTGRSFFYDKTFEDWYNYSSKYDNMLMDAVWRVKVWADDQSLKDLFNLLTKGVLDYSNKEMFKFSFMGEDQSFKTRKIEFKKLVRENISRLEKIAKENDDLKPEMWEKFITKTLWDHSSDEYKQWQKAGSDPNQKLKYFRKWKSNLANINKFKQFYVTWFHKVYDDKGKRDYLHLGYGVYLQPNDFVTKATYSNKFDSRLFEKKLARKYNIDISQAAFLKWVKKDYNNNFQTGILKYFWTQTDDYDYNDYGKKIASYEKFLRGYGPNWKDYDDIWRGYDVFHQAYNKYLDSFKDEQIKELDEYNYFLWSQLYLKLKFDDVYQTTISHQPVTNTPDYSFYKWHQMREKIKSNLVSLPFKKAITTLLKPEEITKIKTDFLTTFTVDDKKFANWFDHGHKSKSIFEVLTKGIYDQDNNLLLKFDLIHYKHLPLYQQQILFYSWFRKNKSQLKSLVTKSDDLKLLIGENDYDLKLWEKLKAYISHFQIKTKSLKIKEVKKLYQDHEHINLDKQIFLASKASETTLAKINQKIANKKMGGPNYLPLSWEQFINITMGQVWNLKIRTKDSKIVNTIKSDIKKQKALVKKIDYNDHNKAYFSFKKVLDLFWKQNQEYIRTQNSYDDAKLRKEVTKLYQSQLDSLQEDKRTYWKEINAITDLWASNSFNKYEAKQLGVDEKSRDIYKQWTKKHAAQIIDLLQFKKKTYEGKQSWYKTWDDFWEQKRLQGVRPLAKQIERYKKFHLPTWGEKFRPRELNAFYLIKIREFAKSHINTIKEMFHHKGLFTDEEIVFSIAPSHESGYTKYVRELNFDKLVSDDWKVDKIIPLFKKDYPDFKFDYSYENFSKWITSDVAKSIRFKLHKYAKLNQPRSWDYLWQIVYQPQKFIEQIKGKNFAENKGKINSWIMTRLKISNQPWFKLTKEKLGGNIPYFVDEINHIKEYEKYTQQAYQQSGQKDKDFETWLANWPLIFDSSHSKVYTTKNGKKIELWDASEWRNSHEYKRSRLNPSQTLAWFKFFIANKDKDEVKKTPYLDKIKKIYHSGHLSYDDLKTEVIPTIEYWSYYNSKYAQGDVDYYQWVSKQMGHKLKDLVALKKYQLWSQRKFASLEKYYQDVIIAWSKHSFVPFEIFLKNSQ